MSQAEKLRALGLAVINTELNAVKQLTQRIDHKFVKACQLLLATTGRIVVIGMGKSGHIANKLATTLASTGSPAFFVHPGEASHGDLGMITKDDVIIALSNSGNTPEILAIIPTIKRLNCPIISLTGNPTSTIAQTATVNIDISVEKEACPLGLAPTSSTTATLVMGDALAIALLEARGFSEKDFARVHPGGALGKRLLLQVDDLLHRDAQLPKITADTSLKDALLEMTQKQLGMTTVVDHNNYLLGIFTDGDLRRALDQPVDIHTTSIEKIMTPAPKTILLGTLAIDAINIMEDQQITTLAVTDSHNKIIGVVHLHDLLTAGVI